MKTLLEVIEKFCIEKLARILYDCVDSLYSDRAELDWRTAENFVKRHPGLIYNMMRLFTNRCLQEQLCVTTMVNGEVLHVQLDCNFATFDRLCGQIVWYEMYQTLKRVLPRPLYTRIRFE
jgi:hypothetical protein